MSRPSVLLRFALQLCGSWLPSLPTEENIVETKTGGEPMASSLTSLHVSSILLSVVKHSHVKRFGLRKLIVLKHLVHCTRVKSSRNHVCLKPGASHHRFIVSAITESSTDSSRRSDEKIPSWAKPGSDETPPWARGEGNEIASQPVFEIPYIAYLLASAITAIAAVGSIFEYINQRPVFGIVNPDSIFYTPLLAFFTFTGLPTSAFLWLRSVQAANKEAEEQDQRDGYRFLVSDKAQASIDRMG
ncbi:hypothetical protein HPP92_005603 [Vanilla planifolia]|uniref:Uncharacterized protein n=1 Tax=Vanilla planifolia TaxID=51239 RepID=A0A835VCS1_VANPL|nr:hypothetical protein HPP92_005603 [Vanilla planifolia]